MTALLAALADKATDYRVLLALAFVVAGWFSFWLGFYRGRWSR